MGPEKTIKPESIGYWTQRVLNAHHALLQKNVKPLGLSASQAIVLGIIARKQPVSARDISEHLGISAPAVTRQVDALERLDFVRREEDSEDERVLRISLTERGVELWPRVKGVLREVHRVAVGQLDPEEVRVMLRSLDSMRQNLERHL